MLFRKKINLVFLILLIICLYLSMIQPVLAQNHNLGSAITGFLEKAGGSQGAGFNTTAGSGDNLPFIIGGIIRVVLGFLGIIFFILIIYSGFTWLTAGGSKDKVQSAIDHIRNASIGLIIVIIAYAIASFIITTATNISN